MGNNNNNFSTSENMFLEAFFEVNDNLQFLIEEKVEGEEWLYNIIFKLKGDENAADELKETLKGILKPLEELLKRQEWFNWAGFICWDYFRDKPILLETFWSPNTEVVDFCRYEFARDLYKQENIFTPQYGFQDILGLTFTKGVKNSPIILEWKREDGKGRKESYESIHFCEVNALNELLDDETFLKKFNDLMFFVSTECCKERRGEPQYREFADKIKSLSEYVLAENKGIIKGTTDNLKDTLFKSPTDAFFSRKEFLNILFWNRCFDDKWQYIFYVPGAFLHNLGVGGIVFATNKLPGFIEYRLIEQTINRVFGELAIVFSAVESRLKERAETIRAPYHEFSTFSNAIQTFISSLEHHAYIKKIILEDSNLFELYDRAKFYNDYLNIVLSYFKHRGSDGWFLLSQAEFPTDNVEQILKSMYKPAIGYTILHWQNNKLYKKFINKHKDELKNSQYNIVDKIGLNLLQIDGKWQTAVFVACFILTCNMLEHGIKALSETETSIKTWHELKFFNSAGNYTFSFGNIYSPDEATRNELFRIKSRFESGESFDFKRYGGLLVLDTIYEDLKSEGLKIDVNISKDQNWVYFDLSLPIAVFKEVKENEGI